MAAPGLGIGRGWVAASAGGTCRSENPDSSLERWKTAWQLLKNMRECSHVSLQLYAGYVCNTTAGVLSENKRARGVIPHGRAVTAVKRQTSGWLGPCRSWDLASDQH